MGGAAQGVWQRQSSHRYHIILLCAKLGCCALTTTCCSPNNTRQIRNDCYKLRQRRRIDFVSTVSSVVRDLRTVSPSIDSSSLLAAPEWASVNIGCFVCIRCSGLHRQIGTHITKARSRDFHCSNSASPAAHEPDAATLAVVQVRSMRMDMWQPDQIGMVELYGNKKVNEVVVAACCCVSFLLPRGRVRLQHPAYSRSDGRCMRRNCPSRPRKGST